MERKQETRWIGLDVSKKSFTAALAVVGLNGVEHAPQPSFGMSREGVRELLGWCRRLFPRRSFGIAMEATGIYSKRLAALILKEAPAQRVCICRPDCVASYARSKSTNKTDKADAGYIAMYACDNDPAPFVPPSEAEEKLGELVTERAFLVEQRTRLENRGKTIGSEAVARIHGKLQRELDALVEKLDKEIRKLVRENPEINREIELMDTVPGIGMTSAAVIHAALGPLEQYTRKQLSKMSGLSPANRESGTSVKSSRMSRCGSAMLRQILYLDVTSALRKIPALAEFRERLLGRPNSTPMKARCACMRKLLMILRGVVVSGKKFDPNHVSQKTGKDFEKILGPA